MKSTDLGGASDAASVQGDVGSGKTIVAARESGRHRKRLASGGDGEPSCSPISTCAFRLARRSVPGPVSALNAAREDALKIGSGSRHRRHRALPRKTLNLPFSDSYRR
jgi:hypothetical protein